MSRAMTSDHMTQAAFCCIPFEEQHCSMKRFKLIHESSNFTLFIALYWSLSSFKDLRRLNPCHSFEGLCSANMPENVEIITLLSSSSVSHGQRHPSSCWAAFFIAASERSEMAALLIATGFLWSM